MADSVASRTDDEWLTQLVDWFQTAEDTTQDARAKSETARDYYDGKQWTQEELAALRERKQPALTINRVKRKVDYLNGLERQTRTDPRAYPRTPDDERAAEAATDAIRYVCDHQDFQHIASAMWEDMLVEGHGAAEVLCEHLDDAYDVTIVHVPWDRFFYDPHSRRVDFEDAKYLGTVVWMDEADVLAKWPDAGDAVSDAYAQGGTTPTDTYDDRPKSNVWADAKRKRVRVCQVYWRDNGTWMFATFTRGGFLDAPKPSPYKDDRGKPVCGLIAQAAFVSRENERYGIVRNMISLQDAVNKRESKALHLLSVRQVVADQGAVEDVDTARREMAKPDGYIETLPGMRFEVQQTADLSQGQLLMLQQAKAEMDLEGPNAAMQGKQGASASGRAIALSQQGGNIELASLLDGHRHWRKRVYRAIWCRVRQFWTEEKWVRVTDDERNMRWVGLNRMTTLREKFSDMKPREVDKEAKRLGITGPDDPRLDVPFKDNDVGALDVDIIVEEAPDTVTLQSEQFQQLAELAKAGMPIPPDMIIEASSLRSKDRILERMRGGEDPDAPPQPPPVDVLRLQFDQEKAQGEFAIKSAEVQLKAREVAIKEAEAQAKLAMPPELPAPAAPVAPAAPAPTVAIQLGPEAQAAVADQAMQQTQAMAMMAQTMAQVAAGMADVAQRVAQSADQTAASTTALAAGMQSMGEAMRMLAMPKRVVRDPASGLAVGVEPVTVN